MNNIIGYIDALLQGWVYKPEGPLYKLSVCCRLDGQREVMVTANEFRADVAAAGYSDGLV